MRSQRCYWYAPREEPHNGAARWPALLHRHEDGHQGSGEKLGRVDAFRLLPKNSLISTLWWIRSHEPEHILSAPTIRSRLAIAAVARTRVWSATLHSSCPTETI